MLSSTTDNSRLYAQFGEADGYWDISFNHYQRAYADVAGDDIHDVRGISVEVDATTGLVSLNNGYAPGSEPHAAENRLFDTFKDAIDAVLIDTIGTQHPEHAAFMTRVAPDAARRSEALKELDADVYMHALDHEDDGEEDADTEADEAA